MKSFLKIFLVFVFSAVASVAVFAGDTKKNAPHYTYVFVHGSSGGAWDWKGMGNLLTADGHEVYRATLTGLGERIHLASPEINLTTHVNDVVNLILYEDLHDVVLVGHSYGGMVITGVADRIPERISHLIFLDAAAPEDGMTALDLWGPIKPENKIVNGFVYFSWLDLSKPIPRDEPQPLKTYTEPVSYKNPQAKKIQATFIAYVHPGQTYEERIADKSWRNATARGWKLRTIDSDHNAHRSHPQELKALLELAPKDKNRT